MQPILNRDWGPLIAEPDIVAVNRFERRHETPLLGSLVKLAQTQDPVELQRQVLGRVDQVLGYLYECGLNDIERTQETFDDFMRRAAKEAGGHASLARRLLELSNVIFVQLFADVQVFDEDEVPPPGKTPSPGPGR
jgi:hypothetical protein